MKELYKRLGIKKLQSNPYPPECNGLVERFNGTLKGMLRKIAAEDPEGGGADRYISYVLFAYREVPPASTGFSPFELLHGHHVREPPTDSSRVFGWSGDQEDSVIQYIVATRERIQTMTKFSRSPCPSGKASKTWYDKGARARVFNAGDKVLVFAAHCSMQTSSAMEGALQYRLENLTCQL